MSKNSAAAQKADEATATSTALNTGVQRKEAPELTKAQQQAVKGLPSWSAKFRYLAGQGYATADIARITGKRYQHVNNVLRQPAPKSGQ